MRFFIIPVPVRHGIGSFVSEGEDQIVSNFDRQNLPIGCGYDYFNSSWFEFSIYTKTTRL